MTDHKTPPGLKAGGRKLWRSVADAFELGEHELSILLEASRTVDTLDGLQTILSEEGLMMASPQGMKVHPAAVELRQQRVTLAKLVASLRIPLDDEEEAGRTQHRVGVRAVSSLR